MISAEMVENAVNRYGDMLYRICLLTLGNETDSEDAVQETFIKYMTKAPDFSDSEHEKAWLIKTALNKCRDMLRFRKHFDQSDSYEEIISAYTDDRESTHILDALMLVPEKFRKVIILHYIEGYRVNEVAEIIGKSQSAVKMRLQKGRRLLEEKYRKEYM